MCVSVGSSEALTAADYIRALGRFPADSDLAEVGRSVKVAAASGAKAGRNVDPEDEDDDDDLGDSSYVSVRTGRM